MNPMISVIIPAYNAADTVKKSVESVLNQQAAEDYEVIVIDDGSEDDTLSILNQLAEAYPAIKILSGAHRGAGAARNTGIEASSGEYLYFADADDILLPGAISTLVRALKEHPCDCLTFGYRKVSQKTGSVSEFTSREGSAEGKDIRQNYTAWGEKADIKLIGSCWNKVFKAGLIKEHDVRYPENLWRNEEEVFIMRFLEHAEDFRSIPDVLYEFYPIDMEKALRVMKPSFAEDVETFRKIRLEYADKWNCGNAMTKSFIASEYWGKMMLALRLDKKRGNYADFETHAKLLKEGLKNTGVIPSGIKKSKTYLLLKIHMYKQVYHSL